MGRNIKFAHIADCHLGSWKQPELQELNFKAFKKAIEVTIKEKVDFVLIAGDLFDSAYPPIDILKDTITEFKKLKEARIPCYLISGSHDSSVSGKTFLEVIERAGFCTIVEKFEERDDKIILLPTVYGDVAFYGYPGRRSGLEVQDLRRVKIQDAPGLFKIFLLHTTTTKVKGNLPIDSIDEELLPKAHYYALGHIHVVFQYEQFVYPGPVFPNNFKELEDLNHGGFNIVNMNQMGDFEIKRIDIDLMKVSSFEININNGITATDRIINELNKRDLENKLVLLRIRGVLDEGKISDIKFSTIEEFVKNKNAYFILRNTNDLKSKEVEIEFNTRDSENIEDDAINQYKNENPSDFNLLIPSLINILSIEKQEDEKNIIFENRLLDEIKKIVNL